MEDKQFNTSVAELWFICLYAPLRTRRKQQKVWVRLTKHGCCTGVRSSNDAAAVVTTIIVSGDDDIIIRLGGGGLGGDIEVDEFNNSREERTHSG